MMADCCMLQFVKTQWAANATLEAFLPNADLSSLVRTCGTCVPYGTVATSSLPGTVRTSDTASERVQITINAYFPVDAQDDASEALRELQGDMPTWAGALCNKTVCGGALIRGNTSLSPGDLIRVSTTVEYRAS